MLDNEISLQQYIVSDHTGSFCAIITEKSKQVNLFFKNFRYFPQKVSKEKPGHFLRPIIASQKKAKMRPIGWVFIKQFRSVSGSIRSENDCIATVSSSAAHFSGFFDKLFPAFGAADRNFAFSLGHTDTLPALGAGKILMFPIFDFFQQEQKFAVFLIALIGIAGKTAEQRGKQAGIGHHRQHHIQPAHRHKHRDQAKNQTCPQNHRIELVSTISATHKPDQAVLNFSHSETPLALLDGIYYIPFGKNFNILADCLRIVFKYPRNLRKNVAFYRILWYYFQL